MNRLRLLALCSALLALLGLSATGDACPFCSDERGPTLVGDFDQAAFVVFGRFENPRIGGNGLDDSATDFVIEQVLKPNDVIKGKDKITLPKYVNQTKTKYLIYADVYKGRIDPYRGVEVQAGSELVKYLTGAMALKTSNAPERLRYCFDFLNSPEIEVSLDAYREYAKADYKDYQEMAKKLPAETIAGWLRDPKTPPYRYGLYASLLGHCGSAEHAKLLREMLDDPEKRKGSGIDGLLAAYIMLEPQKGWSYLNGLLADAKQPFLMRYAGLRTVRFLWDQRPDLVAKDQLIKGVMGMLPHTDMADFAVEDLRKWQRWELTDQILDLFEKESHQVPVIKKSILRFAMQSPATRAAAFVQAQRQRDAEWVSDTEELLKLEAEPTTQTSTKTK